MYSHVHEFQSHKNKLSQNNTYDHFDRVLDEILTTWILPKNKLDPLATLQEAIDLLAESETIIRANYAGELPQLQEKLDQVKNKTINQYLIYFCIATRNPLSAKQKKKAISELIYLKLIERLAEAIINQDVNYQAQLLNMNDVLFAVKQNPYYFIKAILEKSSDGSHVNSCLSILRDLKLIYDSMEIAFHKMHPYNFLQHSKLKQAECKNLLSLLNQNIAFAEPLFLAIIPSQHMAYEICAFVDTYPKLHQLITSSFNLDLNKIMADAIKKEDSSDRLMNLLAIYPKGTFDFTKQDAETKETHLHVVAKKGILQSAKKAEMLMTINRHAFFVPNTKGELPNLEKYKQFEDCWNVVKEFLAGYYCEESSISCLPKDMQILIVLATALVYYGEQLISKLDLEERKLCLKHRI